MRSAAFYSSLAHGPFIHVVMQRRPRRPAQRRQERDCYSLWFVEDGALSVDGKALVAPAGVLLQPGDGHELKLAPRSAWWMVRFDMVHRPIHQLERPTDIWIFAPDTTEPQPTLLELYDKEVPSVIPVSLLEQLRATMLVCSAADRGDIDWQRANYQLGIFMLDLVHYHRSQPGPVESGQEYLHILMQTIEQHLAQGLQVQDLARLMGVSRQYLALKVKQASNGNRTPKDLLRQSRLGLACSLLAGSDHDLKYISKRCGYNSQAVFCQDFKKHQSCTPGAYRRSMRPGSRLGKGKDS